MNPNYAAYSQEPAFYPEGHQPPPDKFYKDVRQPMMPMANQQPMNGMMANSLGGPVFAHGQEPAFNPAGVPPNVQYHPQGMYQQQGPNFQQAPYHQQGPYPPQGPCYPQGSYPQGLYRTPSPFNQLALQGPPLDQGPSMGYHRGCEDNSMYQLAPSVPFGPNPRYNYQPGSQMASSSGYVPRQPPMTAQVLPLQIARQSAPQRAAPWQDVFDRIPGEIDRMQRELGVQFPPGLHYLPFVVVDRQQAHQGVTIENLNESRDQRESLRKFCTFQFAIFQSISKLRDLWTRLFRRLQTFPISPQRKLWTGKVSTPPTIIKTLQTSGTWTTPKDRAIWTWLSPIQTKLLGWKRFQRNAKHPVVIMPRSCHRRTRSTHRIAEDLPSMMFRTSPRSQGTFSFIIPEPVYFAALTITTGRLLLKRKWLRSLSTMIHWWRIAPLRTMTMLATRFLLFRLMFQLRWSPTPRTSNPETWVWSWRKRVSLSTRGTLPALVHRVLKPQLLNLSMGVSWTREKSMVSARRLTSWLLALETPTSLSITTPSIKLCSQRKWIWSLLSIMILLWKFPSMSQLLCLHRRTLMRQWRPHRFLDLRLSLHTIRLLPLETRIRQWTGTLPLKLRSTFPLPQQQRRFRRTRPSLRPAQNWKRACPAKWNTSQLPIDPHFLLLPVTGMINYLSFSQ